MDVFSRLFIWGEVSHQRSKGLIERLMAKVRRAAASVTGTILFVTDGFAAYPKAILKVFHTKLRTDKPGRPAHVPWPNLHIVQVVKQYSGRCLTAISRRLVHGSFQQAYQALVISQCNLGLFNTAFIERLNATFRARMPSFVRRTRNMAKLTSRIETEMFWSGAVYNFCTVHTSLSGGTPAMAADLTDHVWSVEKLLRFRLPVK
jgi:IS1 family transposase